MASITALVLVACDGGSEGTTTPTPPPSARSAALVITFDENPVPFKDTGCNAVVPQGWSTQARVQETGGVAFTPSALVQKIDGNVADFLQESFNSRFGACPGGAFTPGTIPANGAVCGIVGVCTTSSFNNYQFQITGTDAGGRALTVDSPMLRFGSRPGGQSLQLRQLPGLSAPPDEIQR